MWNCQQCTYANSPARSICEMCESPRPPVAAAPTNTAAKPAVINSSAARPPASSTSSSAAPSSTASKPIGAAVHEGDIKILLGYGFTRNQAVEALLKFPHDPDAALDFLLGASSKSSSSTPAAAKPTSSSSSKAPVAVPATKPPAPAPAPAPLPALGAQTPAQTTTSTVKPITATAHVAQPVAKPPVAKPATNTSSTSSTPSSTTASSPSLDADAAKRAAERARLLEELNSSKKKSTSSSSSSNGTVAGVAASTSSSSSSSSSSSRVSVAPSVAPSRVSSSSGVKQQKQELKQQKTEKPNKPNTVQQPPSSISPTSTSSSSSSSPPVSVSTALSKLFEEFHDSVRVQEILSLLVQLLENVIADPTSTKFTRLHLAKPRLQHDVVRPVWPLHILRGVGFQEQAGSDAQGDVHMSHDSSPAHADKCLVLDKARFSLQTARQVLSEVKSHMSHLQSTPVGQLINQMLERLKGLPVNSSGSAASGSDASSQTSQIELALFALYDLKLIITNLLLCDDDVHILDFRSVERSSRAYQRRIAQFHELKLCLKTLGFTFSPHDVQRDTLIVNIDTLKSNYTLYSVSLREVNAAIEQVEPLTPVHAATVKLCAANKKRVMMKFMEIIQKLLSNIIEQEHEQKYHSIRPDKIESKTGPIVNLGSFLQLFGFEPSHDEFDNATMRLPYPGFDVEILKYRAQQLQAVWQALLNTAQRVEDDQ